MERRIFYVVYFEDTGLQKGLDAIRFICNPTEKTRAHITIRGPYSRRVNLKHIVDSIRGTRVYTSGLGTFLDHKQNTVFIKCDSTRLRRVWKKSDYGYNPHITLYNGESREFACQLAERLTALQFTFPFIADGISELVSHKGQGTVDLRAAFDEAFTSQLLGRDIRTNDVESLSDAERLCYAESVAKQLAML